MRRHVLVGPMLVAAAACTSPNPAYEATGEPGDASPTTTASETIGTTLVEPTQGTTRGEVTDGTDDTTSTTTGDASGSSSGEEPPPIDFCRFDLYAINEDGLLYVLDPDPEQADDRLAVVLEDPRLRSWAIATEPSTGLLYVNELASPTTIWRVSPFTAAIEAEPLMVEAELSDDVARATFRGEGELWIGTEQTHRFVWLPPMGGAVGGDATLQPFPRGGDMLFLEGDCAVVPTLDGTLYSACFPDMGLPPPLIPMQVLVGAQYNGIALDAQDRLWLSNANPSTQLVRVDASEEPWLVMGTVDYEIKINDLAPVVHPPEC